MQPRVALIAAAVAAAAAVALVSLDLAYNVDAKLEVQGKDGAWTVIAKTSQTDPYARPYFAQSACGTHFRFTLHNGLLWSTTKHVSITANGQTSTSILEADWHLAPGAERSQPFTLPNGTFEAPQQNGVPMKVPGSIQATFGTAGDEQLYASACREGGA